MLSDVFPLECSSCTKWEARKVESAINLELKSILLGFCGRVLVNQTPEGEEILDVDAHGVIYQNLGASKEMCKMII